MNKWMDHLEDAADKLQEIGKMAVDSASEEIDKIRPVLADKLADAKDAYKKAKPAIEEGVDKAIDGLRAAYEKACPAIEEGMDKAAQSAKEALARATELLSEEAVDAEFEPVSKEQHELTQEEEIDQQVQAQVEKIRSAAGTANMISDYIKSKYGSKE